MAPLRQRMQEDLLLAGLAARVPKPRISMLSVN